MANAAENETKIQQITQYIEQNEVTVSINRFIHWFHRKKLQKEKNKAVRVLKKRKKKSPEMRSLIVLRITSYYFEQRESAMNKVVEHITAKRHRSNAGRLAGRSESSLPSTAIAANTIF